MLGRWLKKKSKLHDPDPYRRQEAIDGLDPSENTAQQALVELAKNDTVVEVRAAAIAKLTDNAVLESLLDDEAVNDQVAMRMANLVVQSSQWSWLQHEQVFGAYLKVLDVGQADQVLQHITAPSQLIELLLVLPHTQAEPLLQHVLLQDADALQKLERLSRGRSKNLYRYAHERLGNAKKNKTKLQAILARCDELDASMRKEADDEHADLAKLRKLLALRHEQEQQAQSFNNDDLLLGPALQPAAAPFQESDFKQREEARQQMQREEAQREQAARAQAQAESVAAQAANPEIAQDQSPTSGLETAFWQNYSLAPTPADQAVEQQLAARQARLKVLRREIKTLNWPIDTDAPEVLALAHSECETLLAEIEKINSTTATSEHSLAALLEEIEQALEGGQTKTIGRSMQQARELLKNIPRKHSSAKDSERRIAHLSAKLADLRDWQKFATDPKRQELLTEIEQIGLQPDDPPEQAARVKLLREQWQQMGRPTSAAEHQQQAQFDALAEKAFEPCKAYYEALGQERAENLQQRTQLTEQLAQYMATTDWASADFKAAEQIMRTARQEWRRFHPCERRALKPVEQEFEALQTELHGRLKANWDANIAAKRGLIESAGTLLEETDTTEQFAKVKQLQQAWQSVGATPRAMDQRLWREFRTACDAIFAQRDEVYSAQRQQEDEQANALKAAIDELADAALRGKQQVDASAKELGTLNRTIDGLREGLPPKMHQGLLHEAQSAYAEALKLVSNAAALEEVQALEDWDADVSSKEQQGEVVADRSCEGDVHDACLKLTLESELAADLPSPTEDQSTRMALQIDLMNQGVRDLASRDYRELINRWNQTGPKTAAQDPLRERFFNAIKQRLGHN